MLRREAAIISVFLVTFVLAAGCLYSDNNTGPTTPATIPGTTGEAPPRTLIGFTHPTPGERTYNFSIRLDRDIIGPGEPAAVDITIENLVNRPLTVRPFPPGVKATDSCRSVAKTIPYGSGDRVILPGETLIYTLEWDMKDDTGAPLTPGRYRIELFWEEERPPFDYTAGPPLPIPTRTGDIIIPEWYVGPIVISFPEGALEGVIEVNRTVTVSGLPVTLERLEFTKESVLASFLYPMPDGTLPPGIPTSIPPPPPDTGLGLFFIDRGMECPFPTMPVTPSGGLWRIQGDLPPISKDARNLTLVVPELAGQKGPWIFEISLV
jgi:hypothetical protein